MSSGIITRIITHNNNMNTPEEQFPQPNTICKVLAGSRAYGTQRPDSDWDFRGIFVGSPLQVRTPFYPTKESVDNAEEDTKYFELGHFMRLALDCNPNILEVIFVDESDVLYTTDPYKLLRENASRFLNRKIAFTTTGYAMSQLARIKGHNKWINNPMPAEPPKHSSFVSLVTNFTSEKVFKFDAVREKYSTGYVFVSYGSAGDGDTLLGVYQGSSQDKLFDPTGVILISDVDKSEERPLMIVKFNKTEYITQREKWSNYWSWKRNRNEARSALEEQYGFDCYTEDTEFLTNNGWKRFDEVRDTDTIATFNQFSHKIEYQVPTERIDSVFTGNLYQLTGYHVDTMVTSNHNMYVKPYSRTTKTHSNWGYHRAAELPETFDTLNVISPKRNRQFMPRGFNEAVLRHVDILNYLRLIGWYVSDGTMQFYGDGTVKTMMISQSKPQSRLTQTITKLINGGKIVCASYVYEARGIASYPERRWHFNRELSTCIHNDCGHGHGSTAKRLPSWCFFLTKREMTTLLVALLQGDGTKRNHQAHTYVYYTVNPLLADDVQRLAFLSGYETSLYGPYDINSTFDTPNKMYHVHINMRPPKTRRHQRSKSVRRLPVSGERIVCFMVPNYTLVTRRNGQIGLHGNTKHASHLVRLLRMGKEALTDGVVLVKRPDAQELTDIRNGKWTYEEVLEYANDMNEQVKKLAQTSFLPKSPDIKFAANLMIQIQDIVWTNKTN